MDRLGMANKVALITGGGGAIGSATARRLAQAGASIAVVDIRADAAAAVADELTAQGHSAAAFTADIAEEDQACALVAEVVDRFGRLDILHNNAAAGPNLNPGDLTLLDMTAQVWDRAFAVNARAPMLLSREAVPHMIAQGGGVIVNTSSGASQMPAADARTAYGSSKSALETLTRYIAAQYGPDNVRCNAILPGVVLTPNMKRIFGQAQLDAMVSRTMLRRICLPEDIAAAVHFLVSDDARQITGELLRVNGGSM
ncbi:SDR family NAD(P)-dependent oxidoreductase [Novosphingobium bradum]|uniref:SDR family NAD(P)-dependent oxidoreductase n=1 Tax=Novosphingobium bradum TaxID=1737444 RepID=A0ABV7IN05_9SPHN